jgi:hypothetical protein
MAPITLSIEIAKVQARLLPQRDVRHRTRDLSRHERPPSPRALVVEQDAVAGVHPVRLAVVDRDPVRVQLRDAVRRARVERRRLALGRLDDLSVELRRGCLVETDVLFEAACADGVEEAESAECVDVPRVFGHFERYLDVRLRAEIVYLGWLYLGDDVDEVCAVTQVAVVQLELVGPFWRLGKGG